MTSSAVSKADLTSVRTKLFFGFGSFAFGIKDFGFTQLLLIFYNQIIGLPAASAGAAIFIALLFDAFADPIVGQISDNLRTRWGRRHPFMYASAVPVAISFFFLWHPPDWSKQALFYYLIAMAIVVRTFITMFEIPSSALMPELTRNYDERTRFYSYRLFFGYGAQVAMGFVVFTALLVPDATHPIGQLNPLGYRRFGTLAAVLMLATILISSIGTHRLIPFFSAPPRRHLSLLQTLKEMASSLSHRSFLVLVVTSLCGTAAIGVAAALLIYFNTFLWGLTATQIRWLLVLSGIFAVALPPLIAPPLSKRLGKRNACLTFFFLSIAVSSAPISLRLLGLFPPNGSPYLLPLLFLERATSVTLGVSCVMLFASMIADVVEDSQLRTGRRSEGLFFSAMSFAAKAVSGLGVLIAGRMLSLVSFPAHANPATLDPSIVRHLALLYLPTIVALYGTGMLVLSGYRINREQHEDNLRRLAESEALSGDAPAVEAAGAETQGEYLGSTTVRGPAE